MEDSELSKRVMEKVRTKIVISNLESEENMKLSKRKQVLSLVAVIVIMLTGSFVTVNAATNGELAEKVRDTIKNVLVEINGKEVKGTTSKDSNGHIIETYEFKDNGAEHKIEIDKTNLDEAGMTVKGEAKDGEVKMTINNK